MACHRVITDHTQVANNIPLITGHNVAYERWVGGWWWNILYFNFPSAENHSRLKFDQPIFDWGIVIDSQGRSIENWIMNRLLSQKIDRYCKNIEHVLKMWSSGGELWC